MQRKIIAIMMITLLYCVPMRGMRKIPLLKSMYHFGLNRSKQKSTLFSALFDDITNHRYGVQEVANQYTMLVQYLQSDEYNEECIVAIENLEQRKFELLVCYDREKKLFRQSYNWDGRVLDLVLKNKKLFDEHLFREILQAVVWNKPQHYGLYWWVCNNVREARRLIGADGLKEIYLSTDKRERKYLEEAYKTIMNQLTDDERLHFLEIALGRKHINVGHSWQGEL